MTVLSSKDAAAYLACSEGEVRALMRNGLLRHFRFGCQFGCPDSQEWVIYAQDR